uniref:Serine protease HTRA2, mitochondrial n=1 Tax=Lygus hesperus TaxID=30085 RepID=A0A0A9YXV5_LYGHE
MSRLARVITGHIHRVLRHTELRQQGVPRNRRFKYIYETRLPIRNAPCRCGPRKSKRGRWTIPAAISTFVVGTFSLFGVKWLPVADMKSFRDNNNFIADIVERTAKAVVMVEIHSRNFFSGSMSPQSNGSGFIVKDDGLIITSAHVVMAGKTGGTVIIKMNDDTSYQGTVEDVDLKADLATIRIKAPKRLPTIPLGSDRDLRPGEWVVAIGSPLALANTITAGVVSTVHRSSHELRLVGKEDMAYIQTDASLTFGNSGGPLVNLDGEVIGVNAMKVAAGISFAVPIRHVVNLMEHRVKKVKGHSLISNPKWYIGVSMISLTPQMFHELKVHHKSLAHTVVGGVLIWQVAIESPAHMAGLMPGDIILEMNGEKVYSTKSIYSGLETKLEDPLIVLKVMRHGELRTIEIKPEMSEL